MESGGVATKAKEGKGTGVSVPSPSPAPFPPTPAPILVRVKRKRDVETSTVQPLLVLKTRKSPKRARKDHTSAKESATTASSDEEKLGFVYCELVDSVNSQTDVNLREIAVRGLKRPMEKSSATSPLLKKMKVIDLEQTPAGLQRSEVACVGMLSAITLNGKPLQSNPNPNLNSSGSDSNSGKSKSVVEPVPELDFHIWSAFQDGQFGNLLGLLRLDRIDVNYQRQVGPGVTALMAAVYHADEAAVKEMLKLGANPRVGDDRGRDAFAMLEHVSDKATKERVEAMLIEASPSRGVEAEDEDGDVVFDIYRVKPPEDTVVNDHPHSWGKDNVNIAVVEEVFEMAELGLGATYGLDENGRQRLVFQGIDVEETVDEEAEEDPDDENYRFNDYPDEEDCCSASINDGSGSDTTTSDMHQRESYYGDDYFDYG